MVVVLLTRVLFVSLTKPFHLRITPSAASLRVQRQLTLGNNKGMLSMRKLVSLTIGLVLFVAQFAHAGSARHDNPQRRVQLNVAVFAYLPDASAAIERIEEVFERKNRTIDLDLELWNPYDDAIEQDGLLQISKFDLVEIDACRIDELIGGGYGGLDELPPAIRSSPNNFVAGAKKLLQSEAGKFIVPHWVCGNFLTFRSNQPELVNSKTFSQVLEALNPGSGKPLLAAMWGKTALGEIYADALIDIYGQEKAKKHLVDLFRGDSVKLDPTAKDAVLKLESELDATNRKNLSHFNTHSYFLPRVFASSATSVLYGYSERLYYTERELQLMPGAQPPSLKPDDIVIRQFPFGERSNGTPTWVDGFVVPKGKLAQNEAAIAAFIEFIQSDDAYLAFAEPTPFLAPAYLLPATATAYSNADQLKKQPLLPKYRDALDDSFVVSDHEVWQGMRKAGDELRNALKPE